MQILASFSRQGRSCASVAVLGLAAFFVGADRQVVVNDGEPGITRPSEMRELKFDQMGTVGKVPVKDGQEVKEGDLLAELNLTVDSEQVKVLQADADYAVLQIEARQKDADAKKVEFDRYHKLWTQPTGQTKGVTESDYFKAKAEYEIAEVGVRLAKQQAVGAERKLDEQKAKMEAKRLRSPISGVIDHVEADVGETTEAQKPAVTVIQNDPLWVELKLTSDKSQRLRPGQTLQVRYLDEKEWRPVKIIFLKPMIDAESDTQLVRLEMPNPKDASGYRRASGLTVVVQVPENPIAAAAAVGNK